MPASFLQRYSRLMKPVRPLLATLTGLCLTGWWSVAPDPSAGQGSSSHPFWFSFLVAAPIGLAAIVWGKLAWAAMACVIYGTVGLALDLATIVQILTKDLPGDPALLRSGISGVLNFLLIALGGRSFLEMRQGPPPPESRPPSPPSPTSSSAV